MPGGLIVKVRSQSLRHAACAALGGLWLSASGCYQNNEARFDVIRREAEAAEARAEAMLAAREATCDGHPGLLRSVFHDYTQTMREIQATRDARVDAELERGRQ